MRQGLFLYFQVDFYFGFYCPGLNEGSAEKGVDIFKKSANPFPEMGAG
jgi:hypothetical protein